MLKKLKYVIRILFCLLSVHFAHGCRSSSQGVLNFSADPILETAFPHVEEAEIDTSLVNQGPLAKEAVGFFGIIQNEPEKISISVDEINQNVIDLQHVSSRTESLNETVSISFDNDDLKYVVKQLLGGLLSANYMMPDDVQGTVSFKTETPVPLASVPSLVRDILARNKYMMKAINGVYQIGTPELIARLEGTSRAGDPGDLKSKIITLERGNTDQIAAALSQILPAGATVTSVPLSNSLILRVNPSDEKPALDLVNALVDSTNGEDFVAVIPLMESAPETVASSMKAYYFGSGKSDRKVPLIVALEDQQALLVVARSRSVMSTARALIRKLDRNNSDVPSLRIISLKNLPATEIADQLNAVFTANPQFDVVVENSSESGDVRRADSVSSSSSGVDGGDSVRVPVNIRGTLSTSGTASNKSGSNLGVETQAGRQANTQSSGGSKNNPQGNMSPSIVPDDRNNALLVHSTFHQFKRIREVVRALDMPLAQVVIEATIVEVGLNDSLKYGVQAYLRGNGINVRSSQLPDPADTGEAGAAAIFEIDTIGNMTATFVLEALQSVTDVKIISSPYLTVLDGREARLSVGDQIPYLVQQTSASETGTTTTTNEIDIKDVGIILQVTPSIRSDNSVLLNVEQEVSSSQATGSGENLTPIISQRMINSDVVIQSGKTVLLGGLIQNRAEKINSAVPIISKLPILGNLFKQSNTLTNRSELLVMITPRVVRRYHQLDSLTKILRTQSTITNIRTHDQ